VRALAFAVALAALGAAARLLMSSDPLRPENLRVEYDGFGQVVTKARGGVVLETKAPVGPATHAALVLLKDTEARPVGDFRIRLKVTNERQLREPVANPWESFWLFFGYQGDPERGKTTNYVALKPTGVEIGKAFGERGQEFLATADSPPIPVGAAVEVEIVRQGQSVDAYVEGRKALSVTSEAFFSRPGAIGLYVEDARVRVHSLELERLEGRG
jgi:hypothetical protein